MSGTDDHGPGDGDVRDLLGAYAVDAVDDIERRAVERLVARDPDAARELEGLTATAALLGSAVQVPAPGAVRASVLDAIRSTPQAGPRAGEAREDALRDDVVQGDALRDDLADRRRQPRRRTAWLAVAATALGAAVVPSAIAWQQHQEAEQAREEARVLAEMLAEPGTEVVRADVEGGGTAVGVLGTEHAMFTATGLGDPGAGKEYQLWVIRDGVALPDVVMPGASGELHGMAEDFAPGDALAVTVEPAGGSREPTTDPVVVLATTEA
jgi:anti-sigma-K factor RskA